MTNSIANLNPRRELDSLDRRRMNFFNQQQPETKLRRPESDPPAVDVKLRREDPAAIAAQTTTNVYSNAIGVRSRPQEEKPKTEKEEENKPASADFNGDGIIDGADLGLLLGQWGTRGSKLDLNGDGIIDASDMKLMMEQWTK